MTGHHTPRPPDVRADVLVIGAGIGGLAAAAQLKGLGLDVDVVERAPAPRVTGAGITLHPNALAHLGFLGPEWVRHGTAVERQVTTDPTGARHIVEWKDVWDGRLPVAVHRRTLAELLLRSLPAQTVRWSTEPRTARPQRDHVAVGFADGAEHRYRLVVGADGINSWTRGLVDPGTEPVSLGETFWRTTVPAVAGFEEPVWRLWLGDRHTFGVLPIGGRRLHVFLQSPVPSEVATAAGPAAALAEMRERAAATSPSAARVLASLAFDRDVEIRPTHRLYVTKWRSGRIALLGDAAHVVSPATTQGGGLALEDAAALADAVRRHGTTPEALAAYEALRHRRVGPFIRLSRLHGQVMAGTRAHRRHGPAAPAPAGRSAGPTEWFRRLYRTLAVEPPASALPPPERKA